MHWCVQFPEETILVKRPSLRKACLGNKSAAFFLSYLLYKASISTQYKEHLINSPSAEEESGVQAPAPIQLHIAQEQVIKEMDHIITARTLRDTAIPILFTLGYINIDDSKTTNTYTIYLQPIQAGINHSPQAKEIFPSLQERLELGNLSSQEEKFFLRTKEIIPFTEEKFPSARGNFSHDENATQSSPEDAAKANSAQDKSKKKKETTNKREKEASTSCSLSSDLELKNKGVTPEVIVKRIEELRQHPFSKSERKRQWQAAQELLQLQPPVELTDIEEAWSHCSDHYWRSTYDKHGLTVYDLRCRTKTGQYRIHFILEHKYRTEQKQTRAKLPATTTHTINPTNTSSPSPQKSVLTEAEAQKLVQAIRQDALTHAYPLRVSLSQQQLTNTWLIKVRMDKHELILTHAQQWPEERARILELIKINQMLNTPKESE